MLKLVFADRLAYVRNQGYRTAKSTLPFKALGAFYDSESEMAIPGGLEPPTPCLEGRCSIQLSYGTAW